MKKVSVQTSIKMIKKYLVSIFLEKSIFLLLKRLYNSLLPQCDTSVCDHNLKDYSHVTKNTPTSRPLIFGMNGST